ncbi:MAG: hypothetical protein Q7K57_57215 [Burkholderiaceae bacterium]|nr:hypothetical protein [Burkholderiaceae bacterium]
MYKLTSGWPQHLESGAFVNPDSNDSYLQWLAEGNTPEPADVPDPAIAVNAKLAQLRAVREAILNRLAGIAGRADRAGNLTMAAACDVAVQGLLDITAGLPAELPALELTVLTRYQTLAYAAELAAPGLGAAFAGVDL